MRTLEDPTSTRFADHDTLRCARGEIADEVEPAARRVFGAQGSAWLAPIWRTLARAAEHLPLCRDEDETHAAPLWLKAGDWVATQDAVARIESRRRIPPALSWMAEAQYHQQGLEAVWPLLSELAWLSPRRLDALIRRLVDPLLRTLRKTLDRKSVV